jgi:lactoylglutathione lyase
MTSDVVAAVSFTKLVVDDLDGMSEFYEQVFGLKRLGRLQATIGESPIDEVLLGTEAGPSLILLKWVGQERVHPGAVILGFTTSDITALFDRAREAGARTRQTPRQLEEAGGLCVGFLEDPEGHLAEIVELR